MGNLSTKNRTPQDYGKVGVLLGGNSSERDISLLSGNAIFSALTQENISAVKIDTKNDLYRQIKNNDIDRAFIALHGRDGEDGVIQGFLRMLNIPFTGSDTASSALAMDKNHAKQIWQNMKLPTADFTIISKSEILALEKAEEIICQLNTPLFVKPVREGSSVGMSKVNNAVELIEAVKKAQEFDQVMIEAFVEGDEYTVSILNGEALPSIHMRTPNEFYDYQAKYLSKTTEYFCPSGLNDQDEKELQKIAVKAFESLGCFGWGRVDFIRDTITKKFTLLEVNTVPGMTETSLVPKSAKAAGINFKSLVKSILDTSFPNKGCHESREKAYG